METETSINQGDCSCSSCLLILMISFFSFILNIGLELACNVGSKEGISLKKRSMFLNRVPFLASVVS